MGARSAHTEAHEGDYLNDLARNLSCRRVSWIISSNPGRHSTSTPQADVTHGMNQQEEMITALRESEAWEHAVYLLNYDEHGGFFDHVPPPQLDAFGLGVRVPLWVISPYARRVWSRRTSRPNTSRR